MKAKEFHGFLKAFAGLLDKAGANTRGGAWRALLPVLQVKPEDSVGSICSKLALFNPEISSGVPSVRDAIDLAPAMKDCFKMCSNKDLIKDLDNFVKLLRPLADLGAAEYADAAKGELGIDPVQAYLKQLEGNLGNEAGFGRILAALEKDSAIRVPEAKKLAKAFTDYTATSKKHAFQLIRERHDSLVVGLKKERATGGRGAA